MNERRGGTLGTKSSFRFIFLLRAYFIQYETVGRAWGSRTVLPRVTLPYCRTPTFHRVNGTGPTRNVLCLGSRRVVRGSLGVESGRKSGGTTCSTYEVSTDVEFELQEEDKRETILS